MQIHFFFFFISLEQYVLEKPFKQFLHQGNR